MWCNCVLYILICLSQVVISERNVTSVRKRDSWEMEQYGEECVDNRSCRSATLQCDALSKVCVCADNYKLDKEEEYCVKDIEPQPNCPAICCSLDIEYDCCKTLCTTCYSSGSLNCGNHPSQHLLLTATQIAMTAALLLGIITIITLFWKLCTLTGYRRTMARSGGAAGPGRASSSSLASSGTLQREVAQRLRDAPPPYCRASQPLPAPSPADTPPPYHMLPNAAYINTSFEPDAPPPAYSSISPQNSSSSSQSDKPAEAEDMETIGEPKTNIPGSTVLHI